MKLWRLGYFLLFTVVAVELPAHENSSNQSSLTLEVGGDSDDGQEAYLDLDTVMEKGIHLRWMSGGTRFDTESDQYETRSRSVGISSDYNEMFVAGFDYDYWGNPDTVETRTRRFKLGSNLGDFYIQFLYEDRATKLRTRGNLKVYDVTSIGRGMEISLYGFYPVTMNVTYIEYDYNKDLSAIAKYPGILLLIFPPSTLDMATGLESRRRTADVNYSFEWGVIGLSGSQSVSIVDNSEASTESIYLIWDINRAWSSTFTWGESGTDNSDATVRFGRVSLSHRW